MRCTEITRSRLLTFFYPLVISVVCLLSLPLSVQAQLEVVSTFPADGAAGVDTLITFEFTFNTPLDTTARYEQPGDFFLGLLVNPDSLIGEPDSIALSADMKTVRVYGVHLWPNMRYFFAVIGAKSITGQLLDKPAIFTFTTGPSLPSAQVTGQINYPGGDPTATVAALFKNLFSDENPEAGGVVMSSAGDFTINYIPAGIYYPVALLDVNKSGVFEPEAGIDLVGIYDPDNNGVPDSLVIGEGEAVTGINMTLVPMSAIAARQRYSEIIAIAQSWSADAHLVQIVGPEVSAEGQTWSWFYTFYSQSQMAYSGILATSAFLAPAMIFEDEELPDATAIPESWLDSDVVADTAESHGGSDFRATYDDASVFAVLSQFELPGTSMAQSNGFFPKFYVKRKVDLPANGVSFSRHSVTTALQKMQALWVYQYSSGSTEESLTVAMDATTGKVIEIPMPEATTAGVNVSVANHAAQSWAPDAALVMVGTHQGELDAQGKALIWFFVYYSASKDSSQAIFLSNGLLLGQGPLGWEPLSKTALPANWLDSNVAMSIAEANGGSQYRGDNQNVYVSGGVSRGFYPATLDRAVWKIDYSSSTAQPLTIFMDAVTGEVLSQAGQLEITARNRMQDVVFAAHNWAADAVLAFVGPVQPLNPDGTCGGWAYGFSSPSSGYRVFYAAALGPVSSESPGTTLPSMQAVPENWIDSDAATATAEANGGSAYRSANADVVVVAALSANIFGYWGKSSSAVWRFVYASSTAAHLIIYVDPVTGALIPNSDPILTTARYNLDAANYCAQILGGDAQLVYVMNNVGHLTAEGKAEAWLYVYYSASSDAFKSFQIMSGNWAYTWTSDGGLGSKDALAPGWMDSNQAVSSADAEGGTSFRATYADAEVQGLLTKNFPGENYAVPPETTVWFIQYYSATADSHFAVLLDAVSGSVITNIDAHSQEELPQHFSLGRNYPNPFNPTTSISYQLPQACQVEISIFNVQGQKVITLLSANQNAGSHKVVWNGFDEFGQPAASGVYLYQLKAGDLVAMKKMLLLR